MSGESLHHTHTITARTTPDRADLHSHSVSNPPQSRHSVFALYLSSLFFYLSISLGDRQMQAPMKTVQTHTHTLERYIIVTIEISIIKLKVPNKQ